MDMKTEREKILYEHRANCPWCKKPVRAKVVRLTITPGVKAETETVNSMEKDTQASLDEDYKAAWNPGRKRRTPAADPYSPPKVKK